MAVTLVVLKHIVIGDGGEGDGDDLGTEPFIKAKIAQAVGRLQARYGTRIQERLDSGLLTEDLYKGTIAEAVLRILRNPDGYKMEQSGNYQYQLNSAVASGFLWFTGDNLIDLIGETSSPIGTATIGVHGRP